jgi:hypothetical protein
VEDNFYLKFEENLRTIIERMGRLHGEFCQVDGVDPSRFAAIVSYWRYQSSEPTEAQLINDLLHGNVLVFDTRGCSYLDGYVDAESWNSPADDVVETIAAYFNQAMRLTKQQFQAKQVAEAPPANFRHSEDFRSVRLNKMEFNLTTNQARVVETLYHHYLNGTPDLGQDYILVEVLESPSKRLRDTFKNSDAWGKLIIRGKKQGTYRLNL